MSNILYHCTNPMWAPIEEAIGEGTSPGTVWECCSSNACLLCFCMASYDTKCVCVCWDIYLLCLLALCEPAYLEWCHAMFPGVDLKLTPDQAVSQHSLRICIWALRDVSRRHWYSLQRLTNYPSCCHQRFHANSIFFISCHSVLERLVPPWRHLRFRISNWIGNILFIYESDVSCLVFVCVVLTVWLCKPEQNKTGSSLTTLFTLSYTSRIVIYNSEKKGGENCGSI